MITTQQAQALVAHLKDLHGFPEDKWMRRKLVKALTDNCSSEHHAELALDEAIEHGAGYCPTVPDLIAAAKRVGPRPKTSEQIRRENCPICKGTGYVYGRYLYTQSGFLPEQKGRWERLDAQGEAALVSKGVVGLSGGQQLILEAVERCQCLSHCVPPTETIDERKNYA